MNSNVGSIMMTTRSLPLLPGAGKTHEAFCLFLLPRQYFT